MVLVLAIIIVILSNCLGTVRPYQQQQILDYTIKVKFGSYMWYYYNLSLMYYQIAFTTLRP